MEYSINLLIQLPDSMMAPIMLLAQKHSSNSHSIKWELC